MNDKALAKRDAALAPQQQRHLTIKDLLESPGAKQRLQQYARNVDPNMLVRVGLFMTTRNTTLGRCTPMSVLSALVDCARLGLEPGGRTGGAYLVPYKRRVKIGNEWRDQYEAQMQTDYRGEIQLVRRGGVIVDVWPRLVYENETFEDAGGTEPRLVHISKKLDMKGRGEKLGAYAVLLFKDGHRKWFVLDRDEIENQHRARSQSYRTAMADSKKSSPWIDDEDAMWLKTAIRVACSKEPVDVVGRDYAKWAEIETARDRDEEPSVLLDDEAEPEPPESKTESLSEELRYEMEAERAFETDNPTQT